MSFQEALFQRPTASFFCSQLPPPPSLALFPKGSSPDAKCAPAGRPGAGRRAARHVSGLPDGSPQSLEPLIGFLGGACLGPRASFGLVGAESEDSVTMAQVHGEECEPGADGERWPHAQGPGLGVRGLRHNCGLWELCFIFSQEGAPPGCSSCLFGRGPQTSRAGTHQASDRASLQGRWVLANPSNSLRGFLFGRLPHHCQCGSPRLSASLFLLVSLIPRAGRTPALD